MSAARRTRHRTAGASASGEDPAATSQAAPLCRLDRVLLSAASRGMPKSTWSSFVVRPETLQAAPQRWTGTYFPPTHSSSASMTVSRVSDAKAARRFFPPAIDRTRISPVEVTTDRYRVYPRVLDELLPGRLPRHGGPCEQPARDRPRTPEGSTSTDARAEARPYRQGDRRWPCPRLEPPGLLRPRVPTYLLLPALPKLFAELALVM